MIKLTVTQLHIDHTNLSLKDTPGASPIDLALQDMGYAITEVNDFNIIVDEIYYNHNSQSWLFYNDYLLDKTLAPFDLVIHETYPPRPKVIATK